MELLGERAENQKFYTKRSYYLTEMKEKEEKEKEPWILSWRPNCLRMEIDGAMIPIATPWDALTLLYTINIGEPPMQTLFDYQMEWLYRHLKQLAKWIMILEPMHMKIQPWPTSVASRKQEFQKTNSKVSTGSRFRESPSLSSGQSWEFGKESRALAVRELCQSEYMVPSSIPDTRATNQNFCNNDRNTKNETMLQELQNGDGMQNTNDLVSLIRLLKDKEQYREETNKDVFTKGEIYLFTETYGITDFKLVFACDDSVFWLEDHGIIYFWSRIDDSMIRGGRNLKEALTNYLFNQKNLCYVDEITRELIPIDAYD
ncbi:hypothetical protein RhiirB3_496675 [Rhizophagus irregularis]|nr:hypothetical protein RhiirB3_496675 [Rhizophagus irregularis]